jgi:hypothetical protein
MQALLLGTAHAAVPMSTVKLKTNTTLRNLMQMPSLGIECIVLIGVSGRVRCMADLRRVQLSMPVAQQETPYPVIGSLSMTYIIEQQHHR